MKRKKKVNLHFIQKLNKINIIKKIYSNKSNDNYVWTIYNCNKICNRLNYLIHHMNKKNIIQDNLILPSIIKIVDKNLQIKPFWNDKIKNVSDKIFLPSYIHTKKMKHTTNNTLNSDTWFETSEYVPLKKHKSKNNYQIKDKSFADGIVKKVKKIKLYLNKEQRIYMRQIIGTYRYFYNRAVYFINNYDKINKVSHFYINPNNKTKMVNIDCAGVNYCSSYTMRNLLRNNLPDWILPNFNTHIIAEAIIECSKRFTTCLSECAKTKKPFMFSFKKKKNKIQTINLEKSMIKSNNRRCFFDIFKCWKINNKYIFRNIKCSEELPLNFSDLNLSFNTKLNTFYINVPYNSEKKNTDNTKICSIDQGVVTPYVVYSLDNIMEIGRNCNEKILKKCKEIDIIQSRTSLTYYKDKYNNNELKNITRKVKYKLRKALHRKIEHIKNMKDELHNKTIKYLTDNFKGIILPPFETQKMASKLSSKTARSLYNLSFYQFRTKLKNKAEEMNVHIYEYNEPYTSKTCGNCGKINYSLGNSRVFKCSRCNLIIDRDMNGARNIFLRNISFIMKI